MAFGSDPSLSAVRVTPGYRPGAIGGIAALHAEYYSRHWGFGLYFEAKVAREMAEFLLRLDLAHDGFWLAMDGEEIVGSVAIDGHPAAEAGAHLRWLIVDPGQQGRGLGGALLDQALGFCRDRRFAKVGLWTFAGLDPARHLYEKMGFRLLHEAPDDQWGATVTEQRFELAL